MHLNNIKHFLGNNSTFILIFIVSLFVFSMWLVAFYPGIMTPDSNDQWTQAANFAFDNHHPYFHTLIISILQRIWNNPAIVAIVQIIIASILPAYLLSFLIKKGLNRFLALILFVIYVSSPSIGIFNVTLWKDIPFSLGILAISTLFLVHYLDGFPKSRKKLLLFSTLITIIASLRHNGVLFIFLIPVVYYFLKVTNWKKSLAIFLISLAIFLFIQFPLASILKVYKPNFINSVSLIHMTAGAIVGGYPITEEQTKVLEQLISVKSIKEKYDCRNGNSLYFHNPDFNMKVLEDPNYKREFDALAIGIIRRSLPSVLANRACAFANMIGLNSLVFFYGEPGVPDYMRENHNLPTYNPNIFSDILLKYTNYTFKYKIPEHLYWNIFGYIIITIGTFVIRRNKLTLGFAIISLFNLLPLLAGGVGGDYRFVYSVHITGIFAIALIFLPKQSGREETLSWREK